MCHSDRLLLFPSVTDVVMRGVHADYRREGNGWDIGASVRFLASEESRWITGLIMQVDAGVTAAVGYVSIAVCTTYEYDMLTTLI